MSWTSKIVLLINFRRLSKENVLNTYFKIQTNKNTNQNMEQRILNPTYYEFYSLAIDWNLSQSRNTKKLGIMKFGSGYWTHELPTQMC